jgi:peptidoglycan/xylan/chitin deacetylase (PgdA/CDA1 family)
MEKLLRNGCTLFACTLFVAALSLSLSDRTPIQDVFFIETGSPKTLSHVSEHPYPQVLDIADFNIKLDIDAKPDMDIFATPSSAVIPETGITQRQKDNLMRALNLSMSSLSFIDVYGLLAPCLADPDIKVFYDVPPSPEMNVYLTFDDGPSEYMDTILDLLDEFEAVATFFLLEPHIRTYPDVVRRAFQDGHALGSHGVTHKHHIFYSSTESIISEIDQTIAALRDTTGIGGPLVRVPYGTFPNVTKNQLAILAEHGYKIWDWNVDSRDWKMQDGSFVAPTIKEIKTLREQGVAPVILLHDMKGTVAHLPDLLAYLRDNGYVFSVLDPSMPGLLSW